MIALSALSRTPSVSNSLQPRATLRSTPHVRARLQPAADDLTNSSHRVGDAAFGAAQREDGWITVEARLEDFRGAFQRVRDA